MAISNRISGKGGSLLDNGVAALAALSAGFVTYAMPEGLFARLILASHISDFVAAAHPPLGAKARLAVIAAVALLAYAAVWTLMRALDSLGAARPAPAAVEEEEEAPRLRRADAHPDAPSRRPIRAGRDLGEPFDEEPFELEPESAIDHEPDADFEPEPAYSSEPDFHEPVAFEPERAVAPEPEADFEPARPVEPLPRFLVPQEPEPEPESAQAPVPAPSPYVQSSFEEDEEPEEELDEEPEAYEPDEDSPSLTRLMQRFESGLGRKQQALQTAPDADAPQAAAQPAAHDQVGHRLRSAITDLGKISAPGR